MKAAVFFAALYRLPRGCTTPNYDIWVEGAEQRRRQALLALLWGIACGAATASQSGTAVGTREQVETLAGQVVVRPFVPA